jgi:hypothetical protein
MERGAMISQNGTASEGKEAAFLEFSSSAILLIVDFAAT